MNRIPSIGRLLYRSFGALVLLLVMSGVIALVGMREQTASVRELTDRVTPTRMANIGLRSVMIDAQRSVRGYLLSGDPRFIELYDSAFDRYPATVEALRASIRPDDLAAVTRQAAHASAWLEIATQQRHATPRSDTAVLLAEQGKDRFDRFIADNDAFDAVLVARADSVRLHTRRVHRTAVLSLVFFIAVGVMSAVIVVLRTTARIIRPLDALVATLDRLGRGDHDARAAPDRGPREIRSVANAVNAMADEVDSMRRIQADLYQTEQRLVTELREVDRVKTDFLSTVSHELRTPLTSICGYTELLRDAETGTVTSVQDSMLETIERNTRRLRTVIEDLLTLSSIEAGAFQTNRERADLHDIVDGAVRAMAPVTRTAVDLRVDCPPGPVFADVDHRQIDRLLINLLSNAVKFTPVGGRVDVSLSVDGDDAVLAVEDSGIGISPADQHGLFTRFFRASNAVERSIPGTGLGLTIVRTIVLNHDGDLAVNSRLDEGTTFTVRLPLSSERVQPADTDQETAATHQETSASG